MVRPGRVVACRRHGVPSDEDRARGSDLPRRFGVVAQHVLGGEAVHEGQRLCLRSGDDDGAVLEQRRGGGAGTRDGERHLAGHLLGVAPARGHQDRASVRVVLRLSDQVGGHPGGRHAVGEDDDFGRPGVEVDGAVGRHQVLRGSHEPVAGPDDLVHARHRLGAVGERGHRLRSADPEQPARPGFQGGGHDDGVRPRARDDDLAHACGPRRDGGHQQRRGQRVTAGGDVAADAVEGNDALGDRQAGGDPHALRTRTLAQRHAPDIDSRGLQRPPHVGGNAPRLCLHLLCRDLELAVEAVELAGRTDAARRRRPFARLPRWPPRGGAPADPGTAACSAAWRSNVSRTRR